MLSFQFVQLPGGYSGKYERISLRNAGGMTGFPLSTCTLDLHPRI